MQRDVAYFPAPTNCDHLSCEPVRAAWEKVSNLGSEAEMALFVDSVDLQEVREAADLGFVAGVTTNPGLIANIGRSAEHVIESLCSLIRGTVFHQLTGATMSELEEEAERFLALAPGQVGLKIPCHLDGIRLVSRLRARAVCAVTAVYSPAQAYLCGEAGAHFVIPYVNRAGRQGLDALGLVQGMAGAVSGSARGTQVLAASVKSPEEAIAVLGAGARHLTAPWPVIMAMVEHPLTTAALAEFAALTASSRPRP